MPWFSISAETRGRHLQSSLTFYAAFRNASHAARCVACHGVRSPGAGPHVGQNEYQRLSAMPIDMPPTRFVTAEAGMSRKPRCS